MYIQETQDIQAILNHLDELHVADNELLVLFVGEENPPDVPQLIQAIKARGIRMIGGIFPGIIAGDAVKMCGIGATKFTLFADPYRFPDHTQASLDHYAKQVLPNLPPWPGTKPLAFVLSSNLSLMPHDASVFCEKLGQTLKYQVNYIGGAAGETILQPGKYIFDQDGMYTDGSFLALFHAETAVDHCYGWTTASAPFVITKSDKNVILELNGRQALRVYQEQYRALTGESIKPEDVNVFNKIHLGIVAGRREKIMRGVIGVTPEGGLTLAGSAPQGAVMFLMKSSPKAMVSNSAKTARTLGQMDHETARAMVIACLSRNMHLDYQMDSELAAIRDQLKVDELVGFMAWGEIAQLRHGAVEFLNESIVIAVERN